MEMRRALGDLQIADLPTNVTFLKRIFDHGKYLEGTEVETNFIPKHEADLFPSSPGAFELVGERMALAVAVRCELDRKAEKAGRPWGGKSPQQTSKNN